VLADLGPEDKFNVLLFAGASQVLFPNSRPATSTNIDEALTLIDGVSAGGNTLLLPAMEQALNMEVDNDYSRIFTILTDGYVVVEKEAYDLIRNNRYRTYSPSGPSSYTESTTELRREALPSPANLATEVSPPPSSSRISPKERRRILPSNTFGRGNELSSWPITGSPATKQIP